MLPEERWDKQWTFVNCYPLSMCKIIPLDISMLKDIIRKDKQRLRKLQQIVAYRILAINVEKIKRLNLLSEPNLR
jgi:hypothetical protein